MKFRTDLLLRSVNDEFFIVDPQREIVDLSQIYNLTRTVVFLWMEFKGQSFTEDALVIALTNGDQQDRTKASLMVRSILSCFRRHGFLEE